MRWMNIILAVSVLTMPVLAGSGDQSKFGYDQTRYQIAQSLSQTNEEPAPVFAIQAPVLTTNFSATFRHILP